MKKLVVGILAHVDAGKTTLAESVLYLTGSIRQLGRVDHKNTFLDTNQLERDRGITIFSKQAIINWEDIQVTLLDTPGHVDFSAEMERTLQVLDYAILVVSGSDGIQGHTETLWKLLDQYRIPTFIFVNKMDLDRNSISVLMEQMKKYFGEGCINFSKDHHSQEFMESIAICEENLLNKYLEVEQVDEKDIKQLITNRNVFPCFFGSALKMLFVDEFLSGLKQYMQPINFSDEFGARVFKISRDDQGNRLTFMKITGGSLRVKALLTNKKNHAEKDQLVWEEKIDQIRVYSGMKYETLEEVGGGTVCAVVGLTHTYPGQGLGGEMNSWNPFLEPVLNYQILLPVDCDAHVMLGKLRSLEEEDPQLRVVWSETLKEIHVQLMGEIQVEILKSIIRERFDTDVTFGPGNILYKETILEPVEGVGHFEPLRHYAEVHLLLEPKKEGTGISFSSDCSEDVLDRNWQRLILTHLEEKTHIGVLTGSPITDMHITLIAGRAHQKHTEGGDFRQATYRALRQGLKKAKSILLEPYYQYKLEVPSESVGRAMADIQRMDGDFQPPLLEEEMSILTGSVPVANMRGYQRDVADYTRGRGKLSLIQKGYFPCHNQEEVISKMGYDSERDLDNPTSSVFCAHGAGFVVEWDRVESYMHVEGWKQKEQDKPVEKAIIAKPSYSYSGSIKEDQELEDIFIRTFGPIKRKFPTSESNLGYERKEKKPTATFRKKEEAKEYLLVDGYNIIFDWEELSGLARENMDAARGKLMDILCNYQGFKKCELILVFDAYKVKGGIGEIKDYHNIHVVYTKEAETADQYIEKVTHDLGHKYLVTVATSDLLEQLIIMGNGANRLSASDFKEEVIRVGEQIRREYLENKKRDPVFLGEQIPKDAWGIFGISEE